jgi:hypothetical protein
MGVPQDKSRSDTAGPAAGPRFPRILYRGAIFVSLALACSFFGFSFLGSLFFGTCATAQETRPQITPGEKKAPRKKDAEPRAVALLKLSADGKASLVPIAILIDGKFWDASAYKASPVPMALEPGTVYEAERTGSSLGLFTIGAALHSNAANASVPWLATGAYVPAGSDTEKKVLHAEATPVGMDNSDAPPRLTKNPDAIAPPASGTPAKPSSSPPSSSGSPAPSPGSGSGDEPPRLSRPASSQSPPADSTPSSTSTPASGSGTQTGSSQTGSSQSGSSQTGSSQGGSNQPASSSAPQSGNKPADSGSGNKSDTAKADAKQADRENVPASDSGAGEANRPRLRRGKPATSFADEEIPGYSKPGVTRGIISSVAAKPTAAASAGPVQLIPAISDSSGPQPRSYGFEWVQGDEADRRKQLIALVQDEVRGYLEAQAKATVTPKPATTATSRRFPAKKFPDPVLNNVQMTTYDLWSTNQPIVIFSADAQMPTKSAPQAAKPARTSGTLSAMPQKSSATASSGTPLYGTSSSGTSSGSAPSGSPEALQYSVLIVAYPDIYNNLHKLYAGVTDKYHLDITPRLELIDALDADGDGRGELLFRETSDAGTGWVIYRATADKLWKLFDSLNPE